MPYPFAQISDAQLQAIQKLARIFNPASQQATAVTPSTRVARSVPVPSAPPRVTVHTTPSPRVPVSAPSLRVPLSPTTLQTTLRRPQPNLIELYHNDPAEQRFTLLSQNLLAATAPHDYAIIKPRYVDAIHHLISQEQTNAVIDEVTGQSMDLRQLLQGPNKSIWRTILANDLGRINQVFGTHMTCSTNTVLYMPKSSVPTDPKVTYTIMVATSRPHKTEVNRARVTVGSNILDHPGTTTTNCASLPTTKCLLSSTISTPDARFMTIEIKDFY